MMGHKRRFTKSDRKINQKNKKLMIDKILSYNPMLIEGIEIYKDANRNFILLIFLGALLINFPLISVPCCLLSMFYIIKMLQFIRYKSINTIVNKLAKDISYKGIYNKGKAHEMLNDFKFKYGEDIAGYDELVNMLNKYEAFVIKIQYVLRNIKSNEKKSYDCKENVFNKKELSLLKTEDSLSFEENQREQHTNLRMVNNYYNDFNEKIAVLFRKEDGEIKKVNKVIEFFENESSNTYNKENAVVLKNLNNENKNLTVYLYKKSSDLQKNVL